MRSFLKGLVGKKFEFGTYGITIEKVADSKVTFAENINGTQFKHSYFKIDDAASYLEYKTQHLLPALSKQRQEVDLTKATPEYKNQHRANQLLIADLEHFLMKLVKETANNKCTFNFDDASEIVLQYTQGQKIRIKIRQHDIMQFVFIENATTILDADDMAPHITFGQILNRTCDEFEAKTTSTLYDLVSNFKLQKEQLKKFALTINENAEFPLESSEIINFVNTAENGQILKIPLGVVNERLRYIELVRLSRVKYMIEVRNYKLDGTMQEEYWTYINKFSSDFTGNIEILKKVYNDFA